MQTPFETVDDLVFGNLERGDYDAARKDLLDHSHELTASDIDHFNEAIDRHEEGSRNTALA